MTRAARCPDCGKETEWAAEFDPRTGDVERDVVICDECQSDRSVAAAFEDVTMDNDVWGGSR